MNRYSISNPHADIKITSCPLRNEERLDNQMMIVRILLFLGCVGGWLLTIYLLTRFI